LSTAHERTVGSGQRRVKSAIRRVAHSGHLQSTLTFHSSSPTDHCPLISRQCRTLLAMAEEHVGGVIVTGASSGIGAATARALTERGYTVGCLSRRGIAP